MLTTRPWYSSLLDFGIVPTEAMAERHGLRGEILGKGYAAVGVAVSHPRRRSAARQSPQEVAQVVRQGKELQPNLVIRKVVAAQPCPLHRVLAFLDPLFRVPRTLRRNVQLLSGGTISR